MATPMPTTPPDGGKVIRAFLGSARPFVASPVFVRFEEAAQALDAAIAAEEAVFEADINVTGKLGYEVRRQVDAASTAFEAVAKAPLVLEGDDKMAIAAGLVSIVLSLSNPEARCNTAVSVMEMLPVLKVRSRQPQAREVDRLIRLAFERLERLEELMFFNASRGDTGASFI